MARTAEAPHGDDALVVVLNRTPVPRRDYRIGVPWHGEGRSVSIVLPPLSGRVPAPSPRG